MFNVIYPVIGSQRCFPVYLSGVGIADPEYHVVRENGLISHQILFTLEGEGRVTIDNKSYIQKKGSVFYVAAGIPHEYYPLGDTWTTCWVVFRGDSLAQLMKRLGFPEYICKKVPEIHKLQRLFDMIYTSAGDSVNGNEKCSLLLYEYIMTARRLLLLHSEIAPGGSLDNAVSYINENYHKDISLQELADMCGISRQHFCRVFKAKMGMRPLEYLAQKRILEAKVQLYSTEKSIADIGKDTGYRNPTYFGMVFKKYERISPSEYRNLKKSSVL